jgi:hypothetical protein
MNGDPRLISIYFHCGENRGFERVWPAVPRVGEAVSNEFGSFVVREVDWDDDRMGLPYVQVYLGPPPI